MGDIAGNLASSATRGAEAAALKRRSRHLAELVVAGYPPEDLVLKPAFVAACQAAIETLARRPPMAALPCSARPGARTASSTMPPCCWPMAARSPAPRFKHDLPNYGVFDEKRVFAPARARAD